MADSLGLGFRDSALLLSGMMLALLAAHYSTPINGMVLFWIAFVLTRPLGATVGDFLDKPLANGGLALSRYAASAGLAIAMVALISLLPQRAGRHPA